MAEISLGTLYDFNKTAISKLKPLEAIELNKKIEDIAICFLAGDSYWMLLNKELGDYSIFFVESEQINWITKEIRETLQNRGSIISIDKTDDGMAYEIWIRIDNKDYVYYLFGYNYGIIKC